MAQINTTELDFDAIKSNLRDYFNRSDGPFKDYDFTGAGLNNILDILAYNTHYNAITAHMVMNESFLDSAQLRGNVVSRAKLLGYTPTSRTGATASINVVFNRSSTGDSAGITSYTMNKGTKFSASIDGITYVFQTTTDNTASYESGTDTFTFNNIEVKQGESRLQTFSIDNSYDQRFIINDRNIDTSSLVVKVYDSLTSTNYEVFSKFTTFNDLTATSRVYFLNENTDGNYEFQFGNNTIGKKPLASGRVQIEYLVSSGPDANAASVFTYSETGTTFVDIVSVTAVSNAAGGSDAEDIDSIKFNAPLSFISQDRAVTADDYRSIIKQNFSYIRDVVAWGGEEEDIPAPGFVNISVKPEGTDFLTALQKTQILDFLKDKKVIGITPQIIDPTYLYIYFANSFRYDTNLTDLTVNELSSKIRNEISKYSKAKLNDFDGIFRSSNLLARLDTVDDAVLSNSFDIYAYKSIVITVNTADTQEIKFGFQIAGTLDQSTSMISSTSYTKNTFSVQLADEPITGETEKRNVYSFRADPTDSSKIIKVDNTVGSLYPATGILSINSLVPDAASDLAELLVTVQPAGRDIFVEKRDIIKVDLAKTTITGIADTGSSTSSTSSGY